MLRLTIAFVLLCSSAFAQAEIRLYGEARMGAGGVRHSDLDFYPVFGSFSVGAFIVDNIGIEGFIDTRISDDEADDFQLGVTEAFGAAVRFQSPPQNGLHAYILLGYVDFDIRQQESGREALRENFTGARFSVGVNQRLNVIPGLIFGVEYRNYYADSGITVDGLSLGLRYEMP